MAEDIKFDWNLGMIAGVKLNLGCNTNALDGWINVDLHQYGNIDVCTDLNETWPWEDNSVDYIRAYDIVEHLSSPIHTMNEAWRVLKPYGAMEIHVPSTDGRGAFQDPTHVSFWNANSFAYYTKDGHGNLYPSISCDFDIILFNTPANPFRVIWVWALCRAIKDSDAAPAIPDELTKKISNAAAEAFASRPLFLKDFYSRLKNEDESQINFDEIFAGTHL